MQVNDKGNAPIFPGDEPPAPALPTTDVTTTQIALNTTHETPQAVVSVPPPTESDRTSVEESPKTLTSKIPRIKKPHIKITTSNLINRAIDILYEGIIPPAFQTGERNTSHDTGLNRNIHVNLITNSDPISFICS